MGTKSCVCLIFWLLPASQFFTKSECHTVCLWFFKSYCFIKLVFINFLGSSFLLNCYINRNRKGSSTGITWKKSNLQNGK